MLTERVEPHLSHVEGKEPLDALSYVGIGSLVLVTILLLLYIFVVRCRYLRRRTCSLCGQAVLPTGLERVEGFWQRVWHEECWDQRMGLGGVERGGGKGVMAELRSPRSGRSEKVPASPRSYSGTPSPSASPLPLPGAYSSRATPSSPLALPDKHTLPSTYTVPSTPTKSTDHFLLSDPYAKHIPASFALPPRTTSIAPLLPPPRSTSRYLPNRSNETIREMASPAHRPQIQHTVSVRSSHLLGNRVEMGGGRAAQPVLPGSLPPRDSSRGGMEPRFGFTL